MKMVIIHDLVEIDAGDTYCYDEAAFLDKEERERKQPRILIFSRLIKLRKFGSCGKNLKRFVLLKLRFAAALDRLQPLLLNYASEGISWQEHEVRRSQALQRNNYIENSSKVLWDYALRILDEAVKRAILRTKTIIG